MGSNSFGKIFSVTTFGESRSAAVGAVIDGCPAGIPLIKDDIQKFLNRRKPNSNYLFSTKRKEDDICEILSGVFENKTIGSPISVIVRNNEKTEKNYENLRNIYRPGHADYAYQIKYGFRDYRGGGRSSGRETVGRIIGGGIAKKLLDFYSEKKNLPKIKIKIWAEEIAGIKSSIKIFEDSELPDDIFKHLTEIKEQGDSAGCILYCEILNAYEGLGNPVFEKLDALLASAIISIGAVKGIEFGNGFSAAALTGKENNLTDISSGISGGISVCSNHRKSASSSILFRIGIKPPPSIKIVQETYTSTGEKINLKIDGNHDICLFPRIIPVIESMAYIVLADSFLASRNSSFIGENSNERPFN